MNPWIRRSLIALLVLLLLAAGLYTGYRIALTRLQSALLTALGPRATLGTLEVDWNHLELRDLRIAADRSGANPWPAEDELRAARVTVRPQLRAVLSGNWRVAEVEVDQPYLSLFRTREGRMRLLPALLERAPEAKDAGTSTAAAPLVLIDHVRLRNASIDFFDASVRRPAHHMRLSALQADVGDLKLPALDRPVSLRLDGTFNGPQRDGHLHIEGTLTPATHDAHLKSDFRDVDLVALQPYLLKVAEGGVKQGALDLTLDATVAHNQLKAPGHLTLREVELGHAGTFAGVPQRAVLAAMSKDGRITLDFTLAGRLDDPNFSLNENLATRITSALAERAGVSVGGVVKGVGGLVKGLLGR
jgi:hypothetical protein